MESRLKELRLALMNHLRPLTVIMPDNEPWPGPDKPTGLAELGDCRPELEFDGTQSFVGPSSVFLTPRRAGP